MLSSIARVLLFLQLLVPVLAQIETGAAIFVNEDSLESTMELLLETAAMTTSGPWTAEATSTDTAEATETWHNESQTTGTDAEATETSEEVESSTSEETSTSTKTSTRTTQAVEIPATLVPDLHAEAVSFRDVGFIALTCATGIMMIILAIV